MFARRTEWNLVENRFAETLPSARASGAELLDRAKADAVGLPQRPVHCPRFGYAHLGAVDQRGHIGGIRIAESDEAFTVSGSKNRSFECPTAHPRVAECPHGQDSDASTPPPVREAQKSSVRDIQ